MVNWNVNPDCHYKFDYRAIFADFAEQKSKLPEQDYVNYRTKIYRGLILDDLFFIVQFVMEIPPDIKGRPFCNHPFIVERCKELEDGPKDYTLDVWARGHFKSSIITIGETIQYALKNPNDAQGIFSHKKAVADKFMGSIKTIFEQKKILHACFPEIVPNDPERECPLWTVENGITLKRSSTRKEPTISAWGLTEGMPTGLHFERRVYDDITTEDVAASLDAMDKVKLKFDSSQNLGTDGGTHRVTGTYYAFDDPLMYVRDIIDPTDDECKRKLYTLRLKPATEYGTRNEPPIFLSQNRFDKLKATSTFACQQLLNPTPDDTRKLEGVLMHPIDPRMIPKHWYRFMIVDPAGDKGNGKKHDCWSFGVIAVEPNTEDDMGISAIALQDFEIAPMREEEAPEAIARMYLRNGMIMQIGVEKVALSTTEIHVANVLAKYRRYISVAKGNLKILTPAGRDKKRRIERALAWRLYNGKILYSTGIPLDYIGRLKLEMVRHPNWSDDGIDMLSYIDDMIKDFHFGWVEEDDEEDEYQPQRVANKTTGY